jgi:hypothetical protein
MDSFKKGAIGVVGERKTPKTECFLFENILKGEECQC